MRGGSALVVCSLLAAPGTARAGRTFYGWLYGTEVMPERGAELQTWIDEEKRDGGERETLWGATPLIGITDQLELALPVEMVWSRSPTGAAGFTFANYGAELRYRMVSQDPVDAPPIVPLLRVAVERFVAPADGLVDATGARVPGARAVGTQADLVVSYQSGRFHGLVDSGFAGAIGRDAHHFELRPGAGISIEVFDELRLGAEVFARISLDDGGESWAAIGPDLAWSHGRSWISAGFGIGLYHITDAPRLQWGIAF